MRMADVEAADAADEIDERVAVDVGDDRAAALGDHERQAERERLRDDALVALEDLPRARAWNLGAELDRPGRRHRREAIAAGGGRGYVNTRLSAERAQPSTWTR